MLFVISIAIFLILSCFGLFIAPHINEDLQEKIIPFVIGSAVLVFISLFILPLFGIY